MQFFLLRRHHYHIQASWFLDSFVCPCELLSRDAAFKSMEEWISNWCRVWRCLKYSVIIILFSDRSGNDILLGENSFLIVSLKNRIGMSVDELAILYHLRGNMEAASQRCYIPFQVCLCDLSKYVNYFSIYLLFQWQLLRVVHIWKCCMLKIMK